MLVLIRYYGQLVDQVDAPTMEHNGKLIAIYDRRVWQVFGERTIRLEAKPLPFDAEILLRKIRATCHVEGQAGHSVAEPGGQDFPPVAAPVVTVTSTVPDSWDEIQLELIGANPNEWKLVDAAPGMGKTAITCARVAALVNVHRVEPSHIWLISFTRTAVQELRNRIKHYLENPADAFSVRIATLDAHAWAIHSGFEESATLSGTYEENIEKVLELVRSHEGVFEYLESVEHLFVDEAQDFVGQRAQLVVEIMEALDPGCGVTILSDQAQAIYGWSALGNSGGNLVESALDLFRDRLDKVSLRKVYRTSSSTLTRIFTEVRSQVLDRSLSNKVRYDIIRSQITQLAMPMVGSVKDLPIRELDNAFVLFRKRVDVLRAIREIGEIPHRVRMSGLDRVVYPWFAILFWDMTDRYLAQRVFEKLWDDRIAGTVYQECTIDTAWRDLMRCAGESEDVIDMNRLRRRMSAASPPGPFVRPDFGTMGPVFGTIHASKGREATDVYLMLGPTQSTWDLNEESRVVFVGATRARSRLYVGSVAASFTESSEIAGRTWYLWGKGNPSVNVEVGKEGDIIPEGMAGKHLYAQEEDAWAIHETLLQSNDRCFTVLAEALPNYEWRYQLRSADFIDMNFGFMSRVINGSLWDMAKNVGRRSNRYLKPPKVLSPLTHYGLRSLVIDPDSPHCETLCYPWNLSGFILAPMVYGYPRCWFS